MPVGWVLSEDAWPCTRHHRVSLTLRQAGRILYLCPSLAMGYPSCGRQGGSSLAKGNSQEN